MIDPADMASIMAQVEDRLRRAMQTHEEMWERILALETLIAAQRGTLSRPDEPEAPAVFIRAKPNAPPHTGGQ